MILPEWFQQSSIIEEEMDFNFLASSSCAVGQNEDQLMKRYVLPLLFLLNWSSVLKPNRSHVYKSTSSLIYFLHRIEKLPSVFVDRNKHQFTAEFYSTVITRDTKTREDRQYKKQKHDNCTTKLSLFYLLEND